MLLCILRTSSSHAVLCMGYSALFRFQVSPDDTPLYTPVPGYDQLKKILEDKLAEYNETNAVMDLVLFQQAMEHVTRIARIIDLPRCALLHSIHPMEPKTNICASPLQNSNLVEPAAADGLVCTVINLICVQCCVYAGAMPCWWV